MKYLKLTRGKTAIVDDEDLDYLSQFRWHYSGSDKYGYAEKTTYLGGGRKNQKSEHIYLHRFITSAKRDEIVDHINRNRLDNRKENLRVCEKRQNQVNQEMRKDNKSGFKGVCWNRFLNKWQVGISYRGKNIHLGLFTDIKKAAKVYNQAAIKFHGEFAYINTI
jgi:hypothetical protein